MVSYPNQKKYIIEKKIEEGDVFFMLKWDEYCQAAKELTPSALNLYMYLAKNKDGYSFYFSSKDFKQTFGVADRTYRNAKTELVRKGYLREEKNNIVRFNPSGCFKITKDLLQKQFKDSCARIKLEDENVYYDFLEKVKDSNLNKVKDEIIYKAKITSLISFGEDLLKEFSNKEVSELL